MKNIKGLIALTAVALFAGSAMAHDNCDHAQGPHGDGSRMAAFHAKHQARLHDQLKLTAAQEAAWKTFTDKTKPDPARRQAMHQEMAALSTPARLERMQAMMKEGEARMADHIAAVKEFYAQLTPEQQKIFDDQHKAWHDKHMGKHAGKHPAHGKAPAPSGPAAAPAK